jgi:hypothetical protein
VRGSNGNNGFFWMHLNVQNQQTELLVGVQKTHLAPLFSVMILTPNRESKGEVIYSPEKKVDSVVLVIQLLHPE